MECVECKYKSQKPLKRCKQFELGGDKKRKVRLLVTPDDQASFANLFLIAERDDFLLSSTLRAFRLLLCFAVASHTPISTSVLN